MREIKPESLHSNGKVSEIRGQHDKFSTSPKNSIGLSKKFQGVWGRQVLDKMRTEYAPVRRYCCPSKIFKGVRLYYRQRCSPAGFYTLLGSIYSDAGYVPGEQNTEEHTAAATKVKNRRASRELGGKWLQRRAVNFLLAPALLV